jgi:muconolactone delta-isomerase
MKYLVTMRRREVPVQPDALAGMLLAQRDWLKEQVAAGTFDTAYTFAQAGGGIGIVNADSGEELNSILTSSPLFGVASMEVQPLADISTLENAAAGLRRAAGVTA